MKKNTGLLKISMIIGMGALVALLCAGCFNVLEHPNGGEQGQVRVLIGDGTAARTVVPADPGFSYTLTFSARGKETVVQDIAGSEGTVPLEAGEWTLVVSGKKAGNPVAESDNIPVSVSPGDEAITVPVTMRPVLGGAAGTFQYAINLLTGASATMTLSPLSGGAGPEPVILTATGNGTVSLAPGYYRLQAAAERGGLSAYRQDLVHIYSNTITAKEYSFIESNFTDYEVTPIWYVSETGSDDNDGLSSDAALATVGKALELIQGVYRGDYSWRWPMEPDNSPAQPPS